MTPTQLDPVLRHVRRLAGTPPGREASDSQLLQRFAAGREEVAFAALVQRHGPLVLGVCRRVLRHEQDAEDAFQATFLTLARNAASIHRTEAVGSWLYRVAHRIATKAGADMARRRTRERAAVPPTRGADRGEMAYRELQEVLQEELGHLPEKYRAPFVLCCLEGRSGAEAAGLLGCKPGTVTGRLTRARQQLQRRLARRGVVLSAVLTATALAARGATAAVPAALARQTVRAALPDTAAGAVSARVATLVDGATHSLFATRARIATVLLLAVSLVAGAGVVTRQAVAAKQAAPPGAAAQAPAAGGKDRPQTATTPNEAEATVSLTGRVLGPGGKPFEGARLFLWTNAVKRPADVRVRATTGAGGRFRLTVARADLERDAKLVATAKDHGPDWADVATLVKGGELTLHLVQDDVPINGRVLDLEGRPVAGATVRIFRVEQGDLKRFVEDKKRYPYPDMKTLAAAALDGPASVTTNKEGRFRLTGFGRDRAVLLEVRGPNIELSAFHVLTRTGPLPGMDPRSHHGTYPATFDLLALPSKPIVGTVREKGTGKPVAGITVGSMMYEHVLTKTDARGHYRIEGAGKHKEYAVAAGGAPYFNATKLNVPDTPGVEPLTVDFDLERGVAVKGRLLDKATGKPVPGHVGWLALPDNPNLKNFNGSPGPQIIVTDEGRTTADGSFTVVAIPGPGLLTAKADDENRYLAARTEGVKTGSNLIVQEYHALVRVDPRENDPKSLTCDILLEPGGGLAGTVTDPDGRPLAGARAVGLAPVTQLFRGVGEKMPTASFTVSGLRPGQRRALFFIHPEKRLAKVVTIRGDEKEPLTVRLERSGTLAGRVLDAGGRPWAGLKVTVRYNIADLQEAFAAAKENPGLPWSPGLRRAG
jgi:RNA polymerase sigma factor (sigma-70 family)